MVRSSRFAQHCPVPAVRRANTMHASQGLYRLSYENAWYTRSENAVKIYLATIIMRLSKPILIIKCLSTCNIRLYQFTTHCQTQVPFMCVRKKSVCMIMPANGFFRTHAMNNDNRRHVRAIKSRVVSSGGLLRPLTDLPGTSVEKKSLRRPGQFHRKGYHRVKNETNL